MRLHAEHAVAHEPAAALDPHKRDALAAFALKTILPIVLGAAVPGGEIHIHRLAPFTAIVYALCTVIINIAGLFNFGQISESIAPKLIAIS
jgi:hypothetical protein